MSTAAQRWGMVIDINRCIGCQTCTTACRGANATPGGVQWRQVLDMETGEYPQVRRAFVPVGWVFHHSMPCSCRRLPSCAPTRSSLS